MLGNYFSSKTLGRKLFLSYGNKVNVIMDLIEEEYVDSVNMKDMVENVIPELINELDPHSSYIPADQILRTNEELEGSFGGIGIGFVVQEDTIMVVNVIEGGPSEQAGIEAGDRLVTIEDSVFTGAGISVDSIKDRLRGVIGTKVRIGIKKKTADQIVDYEIIRGSISENTILASYQVDEGIGLLKIQKFARSTYDEFLQALAKLSNAGCTAFILDLRSNPGGILDIAINMANDFLSPGQLIVYTEGKSVQKVEAVANGTGSFQNNRLVVLMDELSASASEVFAGAMQDNDRGLIIGRRSYGKGLVQKPIQLSDGSALRLTIARYYTPSGRCIQRDYVLGKSDIYEQDWIDRFSHGESFFQDSIKFDENLKYYTSSGRVVYGGGGIMPDIFVPRDTTGITSYFMNLENTEIFYRYAFRYVDSRRDQLKKFKDYESLYQYLKSQPILNEVVEFAESQGIKRRTNLIYISSKLIEKYTIGYIAGNVLGNEWVYPIIMKDDPVITKAIESLKKEPFANLLRGNR
ncbi:MAG: PDZ domain-containing protein [Dysgonamonadaceae bacterium]|nr:PDZ domain-containing protein [Dysgonamonadaceae bacterium]